jgi:hypothetical protein
MGKLRKDKRQTCKKAGIRWSGCSGGDTQQLPPAPASLLYTVANKEVDQQFLGQQDVVVITNGEPAITTLHINILRKAAVLHFVLDPFCSWGLCHPACIHGCACVKFS